MHKALIVLLITAVMGVTGCKSRPTQPETPADSGADAGADTAGADSAAAGVGDEEQEVPGPQEGMLAKRVVYFDYDSADLRGEATDIIAAHARHLANSAA